MDPLRVLLVSYSFPPVGGAGVGRVLKLAKYLPEHGIAPAVLTVENPSVPLTDPSRFKDVPESLPVYRARSLEPSYAAKQATWSANQSGAGGGKTTSRAATIKSTLKRTAGSVARAMLVPDPQILWLPDAARTLRRIERDHPFDVLYISAPPFSSFGLALAARATTRVVLDYRDEWSTQRSQYEMASRFANAAGGALEHRIVRRATGITVATQSFGDALLAEFPFLSPDRILTMTNGYDPDDFPPALPEPPRDKFVLTYAGTVFRLTSAKTFLDAVRLLHARHPELGKKLAVRFFGRVVETERAAFEGTEALGVEVHGYVPHADILPELAKSHLTLCLLADVPGTSRIFPGKIFELLYLGVRCLVIAPEGELTRLARRHPICTVKGPADVEGVMEVLRDQVARFVNGEIPTRAPSPGIEAYHRRALAGSLADFLRRLP